MTSSLTNSASKLRVALGQFAVSHIWQENASAAVSFITEAKAGKADLLVMPESIIARDIADPDITLKEAQSIDGPFMQRLLAASLDSDMTIITTIPVPDVTGKVFNLSVTIRRGEVIASYRKLHLYDAFLNKESKHVEPGNAIPSLVDVKGFMIGSMTCYDVRFPELARRLAVDGAEILVVPAAWVRGPNKEAHWEVMVTARALENTCYVVAVGECGEQNIGASMVVDPLGVVVARAGEARLLLFAEITRARIVHAREILPVLANRRFVRPGLVCS